MQQTLQTVASDVLGFAQMVGLDPELRLEVGITVK